MMRMQLIIMLFLIQFDAFSEFLWELTFHKTIGNLRCVSVSYDGKVKKKCAITQILKQSKSNLHGTEYSSTLCGNFPAFKRFSLCKISLKCRFQDIYVLIGLNTATSSRTNKINVNCSFIMGMQINAEITT